MFGLGFLLKKLVTDTSAEEIRRITSILEQNKIPYEVRTTRARGTIGSAFDAQSYAAGNLAMYKGSSQPTFIYTVYVQRRYYYNARERIGVA